MRVQPAIPLHDTRKQKIDRMLQENFHSIPPFSIGAQPSVPIGRLFRDHQCAVGIVNPGSTCYFAVVCQALFLTDGFYAKVSELANSDTETVVTLRPPGHRKDVLEIRPKAAGKEAPVASSLTRILTLLHLSDDKCVDLQEELRFATPFHGNSQQDVTELITWLFDTLEAETVKSNNSCRPMWLKSLFGVQFTSNVQCMNQTCYQKHTAEEELFYFMLPLPTRQNKDNPSIATLFESALERERLPDYLCDGRRCAQKGSCEKRTRLRGSPPQYLIIVLNRFHATGNRRSKVSTNVRCDRYLGFSRWEDVNNKVAYGGAVVIGEDGQMHKAALKYRLYCVIIHIGNSMEYGHYIALGHRSSCRFSGEDRWLCFNDSSVREISAREFQSLTSEENTPYVLFYVREPHGVHPEPRAPADLNVDVSSSLVSTILLQNYISPGNQVTNKF